MNQIVTGAVIKELRKYCSDKVVRIGIYSEVSVGYTRDSA